jgi:SAM-dependent methyltransferase
LISSLHETSPASAAVIVPLLLQVTGARSVLDVGCGTGAWLDEFQRAGVDDWFGVDALDSEHHPTLASDHFRKVDLSRGIDVGRAFDLTICLEVAEHLPAASADRFIESLAHTAPVVAFSAAIPHQGGEGHVNEQWPDYWRERFANAGFERHDILRPVIWFDERVAWWYRQNMFLYASRGWEPRVALGGACIGERVVHPALFEIVATRPAESLGLAALARALPRAAGRAVRTRVSRPPRRR